MRSKFLALIIMMFPELIVFADEGLQKKQWFCEAEQSIGFAFDKKMQEWIPTKYPDHSYIFQPSQNFRDRYEAVLVENGISLIFYCSQMPNDWVFVCEAYDDPFWEVIVNTRTAKFRSNWVGSYVWGSEDPSPELVSIGTCSEVSR